MIQKTLKAICMVFVIAMLVACSGPGPTDKPAQVVAPADPPSAQAPTDEKPPESIVPPVPEGPGDTPPVIGEGHLGPEDQQNAEWRCPPDCTSNPAFMAIQGFLNWTGPWQLWTNN